MKGNRKQTTEYLHEEEWKRLLTVPDISCPTGMRNLCIMVLMLDAGLKVSEIVGKERSSGGDEPSSSVQGGIRIQNIDFESGELRVEGKKGNTRTVWLNDNVKTMITRWLEIRPESGTDLLFTNLHGGKLNNRYVREFLEKYGVKADIQKKVHPGILRHTFAKDLYAKSRNLRIVQKTLGYSELKQALRYADIDEKQIEETMKNLRSEEDDVERSDI